MFNYDPYSYRYPSKRNLVYAKKGMIASSNPQASQAGIDILKMGGNAIDAAIATAAALTVVEPSGNGIGGDNFSIIWYKGQMYGLNASGRAPKNLTREKLLEKGETISRYGLDPVTVPGAVSGWVELSKKFGKLPLSTVLKPAIELAEEGFPVAINVAAAWKRTYNLYKSQLDTYPVLNSWYKAFCPNGRPLSAGEVFKHPNQGKTLRLIGETEGRSFYQGEIAEAIVNFSNKYGGHLTLEDLREHQPEWVTPLSVNYRGYDVWELPPNGIGIIALMALNNLENFKLNDKDGVDTYHKQIESLKLAFEDGNANIGDPDHVNIDIKQLLSKEYAKKRTSLVTEEALTPMPGELDKSGTVYFAAADGDGNMVSFIQSCYTGFGSGSVVEGYGISLHNRGNQFTLVENLPNSYKPGKRPYHTIIPGFITKDNQPIGPFGIMGGPMQPQAHMQVVSSLVDFGLNPQEALDAPRWQWLKDKKIQLELSVPKHITEALVRKGHEVDIPNESTFFGRGQIIIKDKDGVLVGATESRTDGYIAIW